ncbi:RagB/SusD family nutrient uptake outer membrane protein [Chitinophaga sp.]|uniref:RagB/SusD family nutrient uptake outer membrane protein n=1 Tax=Chitinophaga sp. TaxID=1869181 RepID=UPI002608897F|nr:RagB/SusD family nutrient uptake outer membrane protein [uncultured Chitinophaga sp.]
MKKNKLIICLAATAFLGSSCGKDFLNKVPQDQISPATFWKTEADAKAANIGCYSSLWDVTTEVLPYLDVLTPNAFNNYPWEGWKNISLSLQTPSDMGSMGTLYNGAYSGISACNIFLANIDRVTMDDAARDVMKGEAHFLRAYYYSLLTNYWGGVVVLLDEPSLDQINAKKSTRAEVYAQVEKDLQASIPLLPVTAEDKGRVTKGAAWGLLTRVYLYQEKWQACADAAEEVMKLGYELFPSYRGLFLEANENNSEVIFDVQFLQPRYPTSWDIYLGIYDPLNAPGWSSIEPTQDLVNAYEMKDGTPYDPNDAVLNPKNPNNENRDPRLDQTIFRRGQKYNGVPYPVDADGWPGVYTGYSYKKYTAYDTTTNLGDAIGGTGLSQINGIIIRYADILLMYAEAKNELSGAVSEVYEAINAVRARPSVDMPPIPAGLGKEQMRQRIRHERRIEFAGEGLYYSDIRRWKIAETELNKTLVLNGSQMRGATEKRVFRKEKDYLMPFPQNEIDNAPNMKDQQNPGYK